MLNRISKRSRGLGRIASSVLAAFALVATASPIAAEELKAPRVERGERLFDARLRVTGYGHWPRDNPPLRTAQPLKKPPLWFDASSTIVKAHLAEPMLGKYLTFSLTIGADGAVDSCALRSQSKPAVDPEKVCADLRDQRFLPQLLDDGSAVTGEYRFSITSSSQPTKPGEPLRPLFTDKGDLIPAPMLAPSVDRLRNFPPPDFWVSSLYRYYKPQWAKAPEPGWGDYPKTSVATGLIVYKQGSDIGCRILEPSGISDKADKKACSYVRNTLKPDWSQTQARREKAVPLYVLHLDEGMVAIGPKPDQVRRTRLQEGADGALVDALTKAGLLPEGREESPLHMRFRANADGTVGHCRIVWSTGTDAGDIAACNIARKTVRLVPRENVFGSFVPLNGVFWEAKPKGK